MTRTTYRRIQQSLLSVTMLVLGLALYFEYVKGYQPCPLCLMQRLCAFLFGITCLMGLCLRTLHRAQWLAIAQALTSAAGLYFSGRQLWLQNSALEEGAMCLPGMTMMVKYFSWEALWKALFLGTTDCSESTGHWLGLSMPTWSALYFSALLLMSLVLMIWLRLSLAKLK